jgi:hypothetical protein
LATSLEQQQQQLNKLSAELGNLKKQQSIAKQQSTGGLLKKPDPTTPAGKALFAAYTQASKDVIAKQKEYDDLKKTIDEARAAANIVSEVGSSDEALKAGSQGISVEELRTKEKKALQDKKDKDAMSATGTTDPEIFNYTQFLGTLADPNNSEQLKAIQADLKRNYPKYYKGGTGGITDWVKTQTAIQAIYQDRATLPKVLQGTDLRTFISSPTIPGFGSGGTSTTETNSINISKKINCFN